MGLSGLLIYAVAILIMLEKLCTLGPLTIKLWRQNFIYDVTIKILSLNQNYIVDMIMWPKFANFSISMRAFIISLIL